MTGADAMYQDTRRRVTALVTAADADRRVPACPAWTVKDVLAHLAGLAGDWRSGNLSAYGGDEWTEIQVRDRRDHDLAAITAEWADHAAAIAPALADPEAAGLPAFMPMVVLTDLAAHEHDIRHALDRPGARDEEVVHAALRSQIGGLRQHLGSLGKPPLRIVATGLREWMVGVGEPVATLEGTPFELFRATGGRRTRDEVRAMDWTGDAERYVADFLQYPFVWPEMSLGE